MILDTSFLIDIMRNNTAAVKKLKEILRTREPQFITAITLFELFHGIGKGTTPKKEREKIAQALHGQTLLHLDARAAEIGGKLDGRLAKKGTPIDTHDAMIAGIALAKGERILTRNKKDFLRTGVTVETY